MTESTTGGQGPPPVSVAQEALWYLSLLVPNQISYNEAITIRKDGPFDVAIFRRVFNEIVRRHEAWRTTFDTVGGVPVQVLQPAPDFDLPVLDLSHLTLEQAESQAVRLAAQVSRVPYDLRRGPLLRPRLIKFPGEHHRLYLAMHHLVFDGVSVYRVVLPEMVALYDAFAAGKTSPLAEPLTQYADYARWEQDWISQPRVAKRLDHWRRHLTPLPVLNLPLDHPRPDIQRFRGGMVPLSVPAATVRQLRQVGQDAGATLFQVLATVWSVLLGRYSGQDDVIFATATDLRQRPELESVVGYSLTPLVLRVDLSGDPSFTDLVVRVRNELLDGLDNLVPFERLVRNVNPEGVPNANPIYQTMFILEPPTLSPDPSWSIHQMESEIGNAVGNAKLDLELELDERPQGHIAGRLIYDLDLFEAATALRLVEHWQRLVEAVAADPTMPASTIPLLTEAEEHRQLVEWNATATERSSSVVHRLVEAQAARQPTATAVSAGGLEISYGKLHRRARQTARRLRSAGVRAGDIVALCSEPSVDLVVGLLGILNAGAGYLLLDPDLDPEQMQFTMAHCGVVAILASPSLTTDVTTSPTTAPTASPTTSPTTSPIPMLVLGETDGADETDGARETDGVGEMNGARGADERDGGSDNDNDSSTAAVCCVHDSSVTKDGPKAVAWRHDAVVNVALSMAADLGIGPADTVLVLPSTLWRDAVMELWMPLMAGARIVMAPAETANDGAQLSRLIASERVSFLHASPSGWSALMASGLKASRALGALSGGETLSREVADQILDRCRVLWNAYGAMETTGYCTLGRVERSTAIGIGGPIANTRVYVVDGHGQPVPVGVSGELLVAGVGVTAGYQGAREVDEEAFVNGRFTAGTAYRTGDRARWTVDGTLELTARPDAS